MARLSLGVSMVSNLERRMIFFSPIFHSRAVTSESSKVRSIARIDCAVIRAAIASVVLSLDVITRCQAGIDSFGFWLKSLLELGQHGLHGSRELFVGAGAEGAGLDFVAAFGVGAGDWEISGGAVAVRDHDGVIEGRG